MKQIILCTLLVFAPFTSFAMETDDKDYSIEDTDYSSRESDDSFSGQTGSPDENSDTTVGNNSKPERKTKRRRRRPKTKTISKNESDCEGMRSSVKCIIPILLIGIWSSSMVTMGLSDHSDMSVTALPFDGPVKQNTSNCTYSPESSCEGGGHPGYVWSNLKECREYCENTNDGQDCFIKETCGQIKIDPQFVSGIATFAISSLALIGKIAYLMFGIMK